MADIKLIRKIPPKIKEIRVLHEHGLTDLEEGVEDNSEEEVNIPAYHKKVDD